MVAVKWFPQLLRVRILNALAVALAVGCGSALGNDIKVVLTGAQEIPPVTTSANGVGVINVGADQSVTGTVTVSGLTVTVAHIHEGAAGTNGPVIIPLTRVSDTVWSVPAGAKLSDAQYKSYRAGNLYYNIHSATHPGGEIRGQIRP